MHTFCNEKHNYYENIDPDIIENTYFLKNFTSVNIKNSIRCNITIVKTNYPQCRVYIKGTQQFTDTVKFEVNNNTCNIYFDNLDYMANITKKADEHLIVLYVNFNLGENLHIDVIDSGRVSALIPFKNGHLNVHGSGSIKANDFFDLRAYVSGSGSIFAKNIKYKTDIKISGSGKVDTEFTGSQLNIAMSGSGNTDIKEAFGNITGSVVGSGNITVHSGKVDNLDLRIAGSGVFDGEKLNVCNAKVNIVGNTDVKLNRITEKFI